MPPYHLSFSCQDITTISYNAKHIDESSAKLGIINKTNKQTNPKIKLNIKSILVKTLKIKLNKYNNILISASQKGLRRKKQPWSGDQKKSSTKRDNYFVP